MPSIKERMGWIAERAGIEPEEQPLLKLALNYGLSDTEAERILTCHRSIVLRGPDRPVDSGPKAAGKTRSEVERPAVSRSERDVVEAVSARMLRVIATDPRVRLWREGFAVGATFKAGRTGSDASGEWVDVRVRIPTGYPPFPSRRLRLRAEPLSLEVRDESPYARVERGSLFESLLRVARGVALPMGWSEAQAVHYLIEGTVPKPDPIVVRTMRTREGPLAVTIMAAPHVSRESVARAFGEAAKRGQGRPVSARTHTVVGFVERETAANGGKRPTLTRLAEKWNAEHPSWTCDYRDLRKTLTRSLTRRSAR